MDAPKAKFAYDQDKDIENIIIGLKTVQSGRDPDREIKKIISSLGQSPSPSELKQFLSARWERKEHIISLLISQLQEYWGLIEKNFFSHIADRMRLPSFYDIKVLNGFFSTRLGSGYNVPRFGFL
jgi:hypothetical protein